MSGDGSLENVGIRLNAIFGCKECNSRFDTGRALSSHVKFFHQGADVRVFRVIPLIQDRDEVVGMTLAGMEAFRIQASRMKAGEVREQIAISLDEDPSNIMIMDGNIELGHDHLISNWSSTIVKQDMGLAADHMDFSGFRRTPNMD
eukprot:TRINITY_DN45525_c0_g1_i1.p1 TRINITY_DN45525_c0_g1~~TRINITY_DN45525_c0_g1_i1.p1  ORF type:complete len:168 (+),score=23.22 TRINITY_DN45525_c0_g1_i1:68-505(+)